MKTLPLLLFFFMPALACDSTDCAVNAKSVAPAPAHASVAPAKPSPPTAGPAKSPRREGSTPRPKYLFM